jgi:flagellar basal-body rod protein FlgB
MLNPLLDRYNTNMIIQSALEGHDIRHRAIVNNIANVDTPGYSRMDVTFEDQLRSAVGNMKSNFPSGDRVDGSNLRDSLQSVRPKIKVDKTLPLRADGSNVSIDREMAMLAKNSAKINSLTELLIRNYRTIKTAIRGRQM